MDEESRRCQELIEGIMDLSEDARLGVLAILLRYNLHLSDDASVNLVTLMPECISGLDAILSLDGEPLGLILMGWHFCKNAALIKMACGAMGDDSSKVADAVLYTAEFTRKVLNQLMNASLEEAGVEWDSSSGDA